MKPGEEKTRRYCRGKSGKEGDEKGEKGWEEKEFRGKL